MINAKLLQLVIDASQDGIVVAEKEGEDDILIYMNTAFEHMTGYTPTEVLYQDCRFLQNGEADDEVLERIRAAISHGQPCREILRNFRKDGTSFWNELSITPVFNEADQMTYYVGIQKDVSEQIAARERIAELEQQLAQAHARLQALQAPDAAH